MHELSAATAILRTVLRVAEENGAEVIREVKLQIGELTLLNPEQLTFCFDIASRGTAAEGASLEIDKVPAVLRCQDCGREMEWRSLDDDPALHLISPKLVCKCGSTRIKVVSGREMKIVSMKVEQRQADGTLPTRKE